MPLLTTGQARKAIGCGRSKLLGLVKSGRLPIKMLDGRIRISSEAIEAFVAELPTEYAPTPLLLKRRNTKRVA
jgi:excisionase family DNA binding protein